MNARQDRLIENLLVAKAMVLDLPKSAFAKDLGYYANSPMVERGPHACGATACFGGWVAVHPHFQKQGVRPDDLGAPTKKGSNISGISRDLFGNFSMFCGGGWATVHCGDPDFDEKKEVLARIDRALEQVFEGLYSS